MIIKSISNPRRITTQPGWYAVDVEDEKGEVFLFIYSPDDPYGIAPEVRVWMTDYLKTHASNTIPEWANTSLTP